MITKHRILSLYHLFWSEDKKALLTIWAAAILVPGIFFASALIQADASGRIYSLEQLFLSSYITPVFYASLTGAGILLFLHNYHRTNGKFYNAAIKRLPVKNSTYLMSNVFYTVLVLMITIGVLYFYLLLCNLMYHWILPKDCRIDGALFLCIARIKLLHIWFPWRSLVYLFKEVILLLNFGMLLNLIPIELAKREGSSYILTGAGITAILFLIYWYAKPDAVFWWFGVSLSVCLSFSFKLRSEVKKA